LGKIYPENIWSPQEIAQEILNQAFIDCVFLFFKYWQGFSTTEHASTSKQMEIISTEYARMLQWLTDDQFSCACNALNYNEITVRHRLLLTLHNPNIAQEVARIYKIRIDALKMEAPTHVIYS
jgi:hypothetical protein